MARSPLPTEAPASNLQRGNSRRQSTGESAGGQPRRSRCRWCRPLLALLIILGISGAALAYGLESLGFPPRLVGPYILKRSSGHNPVITGTGKWVGQTMISLDRGTPLTGSPVRFRLGAQPEPVAVAGAGRGRLVAVTSSAEALSAIGNASPGDVITFLPGHYRFGGQRINVNRPGTASEPITVRAEQPGSVMLELAMVEGFVVSAPYWRFENLSITGACGRHSDCEHAFHVVGGGSHFTATNNTITDFNAHFKINGLGGAFPDDGLIVANTLTNSSVRNTANPVTPIDLVAASNWVIRHNMITDFQKGDGNQISYGAFVKGGGSNNLMENNLILCEYLLHGSGTKQVGLSLGGGGTGKSVCRDQRCITEQDGSMIRANLIASCSDDGIYINRSATSKVIHNTLIDTGGISVRFPESTADVIGNLVDGKIRSRDQAILRQSDNMDTAITRLFIGSHPVRNLFDGSPGSLLAGKVPRRAAGPTASGIPDLCSTKSSDPHAYGAFDDFAGCLR